MHYVTTISMLTGTENNNNFKHKFKEQLSVSSMFWLFFRRCYFFMFYKLILVFIKKNQTDLY